MNKLFEMKDYTDQYDQEDANKHRAFGILSYIGILFLIGLFAAKYAKWTRFHTNQGLVLCILEAALVIMNYTLGLIPYVGIVFRILYWVGAAIVVALAVIGIVNTAKGKAKNLPVIGTIRILK